ncbi:MULTISPECIES: glycine zipper 2TM domain-containing protein [Luteibacter]|uniref:glycine zipper 2TM domain-containing protein n=1 Tax=Luteibacter sp. E-22 TaxID=3404050 RepID=UPI003CEC44DE
MKTHLLAVAAIAIAGTAAVSTPPAEAQARRSQHQVCENVRVKQINSKDDNRLIGTGVGAVAGGLIGNQVGGGKGKTLATVAGAVGGGYAGNRIQKSHQDKNASYTTERRCRWVDD